MLTGLSGANAAAHGPGYEPGAETAPPKLVHAAHEFEAQLMKELLRPMTGISALTGDDEVDGGGSGTLGEFASESLAGALSAQGGLGIATRILHDLSHSGNSSGNSPVPRNLQIDTGMSRHK